MTDSDESPWAAIIGPCYTAERCAGELGIELPELAEAADQLRALRLRTRDELELYPSFQIRRHQLVPGLEQVLRVLQTGINDPWTWAQWLNTEERGRSAVRALWAGDLETTLREARHDAWAWSS